MRADLSKQIYASKEEMEDYIYGSADVVGLMCLKVFVNGDTKEYDRLKDAAMSLGSAFQKVNFLRDLKQDYTHLNRTYFPNIDPENLTTEDKNKIVQEIKEDFNAAYIGIKELPKEARFGVYVAYKYYSQLLKKVDKTPAEVLMDKRIRVSNSLKTYLLFQSYISYNIKIT
jgi:phytoene/squalene synthetase